MRSRAKSEAERETIVRFSFLPIGGCDDGGVHLFVKMKMPGNIAAYNERVKEIEDAISSYIEDVPAWQFEELALDVCKSFDKAAETVVFTTFYV